MLNSLGDIQTEFLVRNNRTTTDGFITDVMLNDWTRMANNYCTTQYKWPLSEVRDKTLAWTGAEEIPYTSFDIEFKADAIRILQVGGNRLQKTSFEEYQTFREEYPDRTDRIFSDFGRVLFINPRADVSGTISAFGQYTPLIDPTVLTATTIFSTFDEEGNEALVEKMTSYLKRREHLTQEAELHDQRTDALLDKLWKKIAKEQYKYQPQSESEGMWKRFDAIEGGYGEIDENQF